MFPLPAFWLAACVVLQVALVSHGKDIENDMASWVWVGTMWAGWAGSLWLASAIRNRGVWLVAIIAIGIWHTVWMSIGREQPAFLNDPILEQQRPKIPDLMLRYIIMFGGYAFSQSLMFRLCRVPWWCFDRLNRSLRLEQTETARRQFTIVELLIMMTATALLITTAKRYAPPGGEGFWFGLPLVYASLAGSATLCGLTAIAANASVRRLRAVAVVLTVFAGSLAIAWLDNVLSPRTYIVISWVPYFGIQGTFAVMFITLSLCGIAGPNRDATKTPDPPNQDDEESLASADLLPFRPTPHR